MGRSSKTGCHLSLALRKVIFLLKFNNKYCEMFKGYREGFQRGSQSNEKTNEKVVEGGLNHSSQPQL